MKKKVCNYESGSNFQPFRYLQKHGATDGARKSPFIHLGKILIPVKVAGQESTNLSLLREKVSFTFQSG